MSADPLGGLLGGALGPDDQAADSPGVPPLELFQSPGATQQAPDFWLDTTYGSFEQQLDQIEQLLASAHGVTGLAQVRQEYGLLGAGQTVAVIDSGIAWDHYALGGGLGANYRVVGGWDFAENDADPYDDGTAGSHGTHVAGIVGGNAGGNSADSGVAPGVDLVGLRVFNDAGAGYFSWVENALQWVHQNRNSFENPITAVNLSLGTNWNADTVPTWAMLEDEFAQLEADGIFIAVAAGNAFTSYNTPGLSYPAASSHVVPVMSVDDSGLLSYYSQRNSRSIAAPGRFIRSTVPDYVGNHNGVTDDWASYSGTSMASPYVAGASAIVREAMDLVGFTNITQQTIYELMVSTADRFFDAATNAYYNRLNLANAIDALIPDDDFGSSVVDAYNLGTLGGSLDLAGLIGKLDDQDFFTFTAGASGTVSLSVSGTHGLVPQVTVIGAEAAFADGTWSFDVVAGGTYTFALETGESSAIGSYQASATIELSTSVVKEQFTESGTRYLLDSDGWLSVDGTRTRGNTQDFALGKDGTLYVLGTDGRLIRQFANQLWQEITTDASKFAVSETGVVYSLSADHWVSVNGRRIWSNSRDFSLESDGSLYWLGLNGRLQRQQSGGWQDIDFQVTKFDVSNDGVVYSLDDQGWFSVNGRQVWSDTSDFSLAGDGTLTYFQNSPRTVAKLVVSSTGVVYSLDTEGWLSVNGARTWSNTSDFAVSRDGTLYWLGAGGLLQQRLPSGAWKDLARDVVKFVVRDDGAVYSLDSDSWLSVNGRRVWNTTSDFAFASDGTLYWQSTYGLLQKRVPGGNWQDIDRSSVRFALRNDGTVYWLASDGRVKEVASTRWSNIASMQLTEDGRLELKCADGGTYWCAGRFSLSREVGQDATSFAGRFVSSNASQAGGNLNASTIEAAVVPFVLDVAPSFRSLAPPGSHLAPERGELEAYDQFLAGEITSWRMAAEVSARFDWKDYEADAGNALQEDVNLVASQLAGLDDSAETVKGIDHLFERFGKNG